MKKLLRRLEELAERKVKMGGITFMSLADPRHGTLSYTADMGEYIYTIRELDPQKGIWGIQVRGGLNPPDGVLLKKRFQWEKKDTAGDAIGALTDKEDAPVYQAAKYISSGKAGKDVEGEKYVKANKRMWEDREIGEAYKKPTTSRESVRLANQIERDVREILKKNGKLIVKISEDAIFANRAVGIVEDAFIEKGVPKYHPIWAVLRDIEKKLGDLTESVVNARQHGLK